jgi:hypothetical protein
MVDTPKGRPTIEPALSFVSTITNGATAWDVTQLPTPASDRRCHLQKKTSAVVTHIDGAVFL